MCLVAMIISFQSDECVAILLQLGYIVLAIILIGCVLVASMSVIGGMNVPLIWCRAFNARSA